MSRSERDVLIATRPFTSEDLVRSWWSLWTTLIIASGLLAIAALAPWIALRVLSAVVGGLVIVRLFILYHDHMHGSLLRTSPVAKALLYVYGCLVLAPPSSWRRSHNYHHAHLGQLTDNDSGSFQLMTAATWRSASFTKRLAYRIHRHPLIILSAYVTVFLWSLTLEPLIADPRRHWDCGLAILLHGSLLALLWWLGGPLLALFVMILPLTVAAMLGAYLFYVQHNFPGMSILRPDVWTNHRASLQTSSFLKLGPVLRWITGDIGYHHVHHLNLAIPFYRLAETMEANPELQHPITTTLSPRDIRTCLALKLWDEERGRMVGFGEAAIAPSL